MKWGGVVGRNSMLAVKNSIAVENSNNSEISYKESLRPFEFAHFLSTVVMAAINNLSNKSGPDKYSNFMQNHHIYGENNVNLINFSWPRFILQIVYFSHPDDDGRDDAAAGGTISLIK